MSEQEAWIIVAGLPLNQREAVATVIEEAETYDEEYGPWPTLDALAAKVREANT